MDAATIEETNRIRVSLGMKPLPVPGADASNDPAASEPESDEDPGSNMETREAQAQDNYKKYQEAEAAKRRREEKSAAVRRARELAQRNLVLEGKGLGEEEESGDLDAKSWLTGQKKRQKKIDKARKLEEELAAAEAAAAASVQYTSKDLAGIKVGHDMSSFLDGDEQVLTLKDSNIDANDEEGDELENVGLREQESLQNKLDLLKKKPGYNPMNDEEAGGILSQYDEEINGKKRKRFTLDTDGMNAELADILEEPEQKQKKPQSVSLDDIVSGDAPASSDYLDVSEIKMKKPKKKKSKHTRQKQYDDDLFAPEAVETNGDAMDVDNKATARKTQKTESDTFVDDDDLQASLAAQRRNALKRRKKGRPEDVAKQLKEQGEGGQDQDQNQGGDNADGGLVIGAVSEFVSGLSKPEDEEERKPKKARSRTKEPEPEPEPEPETEMKIEPEEDQAMEDVPTEAYKQESPQPAKDEEEAENEEEKMVGSGMGAALSLLRERGLVEESQGDEQYESFRKRQEFLAKKRMLEEELDEQTRQQRERDRASGRLDRMSVREREDYARQQNQWRDQQQSRRMAELFEANYQPKVDIKYVDDHGRSLDQKGAFKHLSHHFHGKGSGKGKTEKLLKKIDEEKRRDAQSMFDASESTGMGRATAQQLKKRQEAGVRLG